MLHSSEPTRELAVCLTAQADQALRRHQAILAGAESAAIRQALLEPDRVLIEERTRAIMRFWSWDLSLESEHPIVRWLLDFVQPLPDESYWLLRIVADSNAVEKAGRKDRFGVFAPSVIMAPRIIF